MLLLFEGEDAVRKIYEVTGSIRQRWMSGQTVRDTYGDMVRDPVTNVVEYFEPAVLVGASTQVVSHVMRMLLKYLAKDAGLVRGAMDFQTNEDVQRTLVMLKPDNWRQPSLRAGNIMDLLSSAGLRIVGVKKFAMSVAQAEEFYGPVKENLKKVFKHFGSDRAAQALAREFGFPVDAAKMDDLCNQLAPLFAEREFENIVEFMTGHRPSICSAEEKFILARKSVSRLSMKVLMRSTRSAISWAQQIRTRRVPDRSAASSVRISWSMRLMPRTRSKMRVAK